MGDYNTQAHDLVNSLAIAVANWSTAMAVESVRWLIASLGQTTEPDLGAIVPVYDRMLAISLLIVGAVIALALIERIAWSSQGTGLSLMPRVAVSDAVAQSGGAGPHVSTFGLVVTALSLSLLTVIVHLELVVRSALILTVTSFIPLISVMAIWPRLAGAAAQLGSFLIGLLLAKFVVATSVYVGFRLVVLALASPIDTDTTENWMASGVAVLLIAALSPLVIFQAVRIVHVSAGQVARGWVGGLVAFAPPTRMLGKAQTVGRSLVNRARPHASKVLSSFKNRLS